MIGWLASHLGLVLALFVFLAAGTYVISAIIWPAAKVQE